ncbi:MAG: sodium:solute symporter family protein [Candidatus Krumholzibacteria bacterium]|jgi:SSS family solute:Na+ symporter|nr:sodium:solute symporter family protein [Candidatus Krumholzibacteria bacterium]MDP6668922.1 sodium:solute symporter family protein [Candidatus Krumholzibacteria bacterium]MDP6797750.1 sodium:solute symporter family protein [Candidatus Krumholzibacteria bacterium]MDP7022244.1 sodium:solute symporter family protein [Candidatus Krumholzibacteria bacterium]
MSLSALLLYALFLLYVVLRLFRRKAKDEKDYLLASRSLTLPAFVATTVSSWYGGILGVGEYSYSYGLSNWLVFGVPYYLYALIFALFLAKRARRSSALTVPDQLRQRYGSKVAILGSSVLFFMTAPAAYVLALGTLLVHLTGLPLAPAIVVGTIFSLAYVFRGGLRAVVMTDKIQFTLMFLGFAILLPMAVSRFGGLSWLRDNLPAEHLSWNGGQPFQAIAVWYLIAASTLVEPAFYQRCFAAKDENTARRGLFLSVIFWIVFDFMTTTTGLYARAAMPALADAQFSYPLLAEAVLPPFASALFMLGLLATVMSTIDSYAFLAAVTFGRDIVWRLRGSRGDSNRFSRMGLLVTGLVSVGLALWRESIVGLWHDLGSVGTPVLLFPLALSFGRRKIAAPWILASMISGGTISLAWLMAGKAGLALPLDLEAIFPGLMMSGLICLAGWIRARN